MSITLRSFVPEDSEALFDICICTGDAGADARAKEDDPDLLPQVFVAPYLQFAPDLAFVAEDKAGVCGYALGVADTTAFNAWAAADHFADLSRSRPDPGPDTAVWNGSDWLRRWIHHPPGPLLPEMADWPAHGHIDLLPRAQGQGIAAPLMHRLMDALAARGAPGLHLGVDSRNTRARRFYEKLGFQDAPLPRATGSDLLVRTLDRDNDPDSATP